MSNQIEKVNPNLPHSLSGTDDDETLLGILDQSNIILGYNGNDKILGGNLDDTIDGGHGDDVLAGNDGNDIIHGGSGQDIILGGQGADHLFGDGGDDMIYGGSQDDAIDILEGGSGNDTLYAGFKSKDNIYNPGNGIAKLFGNNGQDRLFGSHNNDILDGGDGDDFFIPYNGNDIMKGGQGNDNYFQPYETVGKKYIYDPALEEDKIFIKVENDKQKISLTRFDIEVLNKTFYRIDCLSNAQSQVYFEHGHINMIITYDNQKNIFQKFALDQGHYIELNPLSNRMLHQLDQKNYIKESSLPFTPIKSSTDVGLI